MQFLAQPVAQAVVRAVADQRVHEAHRAPVVALDEVAEPPPDGVPLVREVVDDGPQEVPGNERPRTDARRRRLRSTGESWSMRVAITASMVSGSESMPLASWAAATSSRRNSGLPPDRSARAAISWGGRGVSSVAR